MIELFSVYHVICGLICYLAAISIYDEDQQNALYLSATLYILTIVIDHLFFPENHTNFYLYFGTWVVFDLAWAYAMVIFNRYWAALALIPMAIVELIAMLGGKHHPVFTYYQQTMVILNALFIFALVAPRGDYTHNFRDLDT